MFRASVRVMVRVGVGFEVRIKFRAIDLALG